MEFQRQLEKYYQRIHGLNFELVEKCAFYLNKIDFSNEIDIQDNVKLICQTLNNIFQEVIFETMNKALTQ